MKKRKLKKGNRILALVMVLLMTVGLWNGYPAMTANAAGYELSVTFRSTSGGRVEYYDGADWQNITSNTSSAVNAEKVRIVPDSNYEIDWTAIGLYQGGVNLIASDAPNASDIKNALAGGGYSLGSGGAYALQDVEFKSSNGGSTGPATPPAGTPGPDDITLNFTNAGQYDVEGIKVNGNGLSAGGTGSGYSVTGTGVGYGSSYSGSETNTIEFCNAFGAAAIVSATINGTDYPATGSEPTVVTAVVPAADTYNITLTYGAASDDITIVWAYDRDEAIRLYGNDDAYVEHGKVEVVSITRGSTIIYDSTHPSSSVNVSASGGYVALKKGDDVVLRLIPDYGYQLREASANGQTLVPQDTVSTFNLTNIQGNLHFAGVFIPEADEIVTSGSTVQSASIANGQNAASSGNLNMNIADNTGYGTDVTDVVSGENVTQVASVDISLSQVVSKGIPGENWTSSITEFANPVTVGINLGSMVPEDGRTFSVVRDHNGTLQELDATYDAASNTLYFPTNQFSTYTIVTKVTDQSQPSAPAAPAPVASNPGHSHTYRWVVTTAATPERTGITAHICSGCGRVDATQIIGRDAAMYQSVMQELTEKIVAVQNGTGQEPIVLDMGDWYSIPRAIMDKIRTCGKDVIVNYRYQGKEYSVLIPNGKCVDLRIPWYGPLLLEYLYGNH